MKVILQLTGCICRPVRPQRLPVINKQIIIDESKDNLFLKTFLVNYSYAISLTALLRPEGNLAALNETSFLSFL
jgi:hypothetical protein